MRKGSGRRKAKEEITKVKAGIKVEKAKTQGRGRSDEGKGEGKPMKGKEKLIQKQQRK